MRCLGFFCRRGRKRGLIGEVYFRRFFVCFCSEGLRFELEGLFFGVEGYCGG